MSNKKIVVGTGITAGRDVNISGISGSLAIGEKITQTHIAEKKCEKLEAYLTEHSKILVNGPIKNWHGRHSGGGQSADYYYECIGGLISATYRPHTKSQITYTNDYAANIPKYANLVIEHLKSGYTDNVDTWFDSANTAKSYLEKKFKIFETIKEKILVNIPKDFKEFRDINEHTGAWYLLPRTIVEIYETIEKFINNGELAKFQIQPQSDLFTIGIDCKTVAETREKNLADEFKETVNDIVITEDFIKQINLCIAEKKRMDEKINQFYQEFDRIIDDFENGHINLKGTCNRCKLWHDELGALKDTEA